MDRSDFRDAVLAQPDLTHQLSAATDLIRRTLLDSDYAGAGTGALSTRVQTLQGLHRDIMSLLEPMVPPNTSDPISFIEQRMELTAKATELWLKERRRLRYAMRHRVIRRDFREEQLGAPALRDFERESLRLVPKREQSLEPPDGSCRAYADAEPFIDAHVSRRARAAAYSRWLRPGVIEEGHLRSPHESALLGQRGVFAVRDIPAGTCVGVYAGQLLDKTEKFLTDDGRYLMSLRCSGPAAYTINGEGLISLANTLFEYDERGRWTRHPEDGYELQTVAFEMALPNGQTIGLPAYFTAHDIPAGRELRWNYRLGKH